MNKVQTFEVKELDGGNAEVLFLINGKPRRMAFCTHLQDANDIVDALNRVHCPEEWLRV